MEAPRLGILKGTRRIVFLDIDGVIDTGISRTHPLPDRQLLEELSEKTGNPVYRTMNPGDVSAALQWDKESMENLKSFLDEFDAVVVMESTWVLTNSLEEIKALFALWDMDSYIIGIIPDRRRKDAGIDQYVREHAREMGNYLIFDDRPVFDGCERQVKTNWHLGPEDIGKARLLFS